MESGTRRHNAKTGKTAKPSAARHEQQIEEGMNSTPLETKKPSLRIRNEVKIQSEKGSLATTCTHVEELAIEPEGTPKKNRKREYKKTDTVPNDTASLGSPKISRKRPKTESIKVEDEASVEVDQGIPKAKRRRKTKEEKEAEAMPLATRTTGLRMFVGAHVSGAKGPSQMPLLSV